MQLQEEMIKKEEDKQCTFRPTSKETDGVLSFDNFLKKQEDHVKRKGQFLEDRLKEKEKEELQELQDRPDISNASKILAEPQGASYERLCAKKGSQEPKQTSREKAAQKAGIQRVTFVRISLSICRVSILLLVKNLIVWLELLE